MNEEYRSCTENLANTMQHLAHVGKMLGKTETDDVTKLQLTVQILTGLAICHVAEALLLMVRPESQIVISGMN